MADEDTTQQRLDEIQDRLRRIEAHLGIQLTGPNAEVVEVEGNVATTAEGME